MDAINNMRAFLQVCRTHSFVGAARHIGVAPSVVTKRVGQLERQLGTTLLERTTRRVTLTSDGIRQLGAIEQLVRDYEAVLAGAHDRPDSAGGTLRVSAPAAMATLVLGPLLASFGRSHPAVVLDVTILDRSVNPVEERFDVSLAVLPASFEGVAEEVLCPYPRLLCASPGYVRQSGLPTQPHDLRRHRCVGFGPGGYVWTFGGPSGPVQVPMRPAAAAADSRMVIELVREGAGIGVLSAATVHRDVRDGTLVVLLPQYPLPMLQVRALYPERRLGSRTDLFVRHVGDGLRRTERSWCGLAGAAAGELMVSDEAGPHDQPP